MTEIENAFCNSYRSIGSRKNICIENVGGCEVFCVDNLPIPLLEKFASLMPEIHGEDVQNVALGIDARSGRSLDELEIVLDRMKKAGYDFEILFLDAQDSVLVKRYKETRRSHPLAMGEEWMMESGWKERRCVF